MANSISHASLPYPIRKARFTVLVPFLDADGDPTDPTTPDTEFSLDAGAFGDTAEEVSTISGSNGVGYITLTGAETDGSALALCFKVASGPKATLMALYPRNLPTLSSGTLSAGSAGGGTLGTVLAYDLTGCFIRTTGGTGGGGTGGANNQARRIASYTTSTGAFTVVPDWAVTPDTDTTYDVLLPEGVTAQMLKTLNPTTAGRTLDVASTGEAGLDFDNIKDATGSHTLTNITVPTVTDVTNAVKISNGTGSGQLDFTSGVVKANLINIAGSAVSTSTAQLGVNVVTFADNGLKKNAAFTELPFIMLDETTGEPTAGLTVSVERLLVGGSFSAGGLNNVQDKGDGVYTVDGLAGDSNSVYVTFKATATGARATMFTLITVP